MKIEVGDRVTYKDGYIGIVIDNEEINHQTVVRDREIIKVERIGQNGWEVVEEKKELLTEEEREFLKHSIKYYEIDTIKFYGCKEVNMYNNDELINILDYPKNMEFVGVETERKYTPKELRIGGINNGFRF